MLGIRFHDLLRCRMVMRDNLMLWLLHTVLHIILKQSYQDCNSNMNDTLRSRIFTSQDTICFFFFSNCREGCQFYSYCTTEGLAQTTEGLRVHSLRVLGAQAPGACPESHARGTVRPDPLRSARPLWVHWEVPGLCFTLATF